MRLRGSPAKTLGPYTLLPPAPPPTMAAAAAAVRGRAHPVMATVPSFLTWRGLRYRTYCCGRLGFVAPPPPPGSSPPVIPGDKVLEAFTEEFEIGSHRIKLETGLMARFANGSVVFSMGDTHVLSTVACGKGDAATKDFLPLTVEYQEKQYAQGLIPTTFMRREGAPRERELLCGRLIDRPIRPLFPAGFYHEVQIMINVLASDRTQDPDVMAANATSAALMLSDIPWDGPIGVIRLGRVDGQFVINPSMHELSLSDLNLVYACTRDKTLMIDVQAREISERDLEAGLRLAHPEAVKYIDPQIRLAEKAGKRKKDYRLSIITQRISEKIESLTAEPIDTVFTDPSHGKFERGEALEKITQNAKAKLEEDCDEESLKFLPRVVDDVRKKIVRKRIIEEGLRVDGRRLDEVRPLYCKSHKFPVLHGSALFSRGDTQILCTVTLGTPGDAQQLDSLVGPSSKRFMLHYSFPPFSINEVGKRGGLNRREVGHGTLAEKALLAVLPPEEDFPYTVRVYSEVLASDGSTSMATVCGGSMALMDAGIPLREHVAGISVGLVSDVDPSTRIIKDYRILTDILGLEDHLGDMDFKIAGTRKGVTAIQLDIKPAGIPLDIVCESLYHARMGRMPILDRMEQEIRIPRAQDDINAPRLATLTYSNNDIWRFFGTFQRKKTEKETGARIFVGDGTVTIVAKDQEIMEKTQDKINLLIGREIEVGGIYRGVVTSIKEYGAFVEFSGGQQGLVHISELSHKQVSKVSDVVTLGEELSVKCIERDLRGNMKLSLKALQCPSGPEKTHVTIIAPSIQEVGTWENASNCTKFDETESNDSECEVDPAAFSTPAVVIRSPVECDVPEISGNKNESQKSKSNIKHSPDKTFSSQRDSRDLLALTGSFPGKKIRSSLSNGRRKLDTEVVSGRGSNHEAVDNTSKTTQTDVGIEMSTNSTPVHSKNLKLGDRLTATVHQIHSGGLVLDLGGGVHGMYRFEVSGRRDFNVGMTVRVKCSSFNQKGIPVMSLLEK